MVPPYCEQENIARWHSIAFSRAAEHSSRDVSKKGGEMWCYPKSLLIGAAVATLALNSGGAADATRASRPLIRQNAELGLVNKSDWWITTLQISHCGTGDWGPNQLDTPLLPGRAFVVTNILPGCYDLRVSAPLFLDCVIGGAEMRGFQEWTITSWTFTRSALGDCSHISRIVSAGSRPLR